MKRKRYTDEQIAFVLRQAEAGTPIGEFCRKTGIADIQARPIEPFISLKSKASLWTPRLLLQDPAHTDAALDVIANTSDVFWRDVSGHSADTEKPPCWEALQVIEI